MQDAYIKSNHPEMSTGGQYGALLIQAVEGQRSRVGAKELLQLRLTNKKN